MQDVSDTTKPETYEEQQPTTAQRAFIKAIAREDRVTYAAAARAYVALQELLDRLALKKDEDFNRAEMQDRILSARLDADLSLRRMVNLYDNENRTDTGKLVQVSTRTCTHPRCGKPTRVDSYYYCLRHFETQEPDDGELVYAQWEGTLALPAAVKANVPTGEDIAHEFLTEE